jgi:hypothetical protein
MKHNTWKLLDSAVFEVLEHRQMMSASPLSTVAFTGGKLTINDTNPNASSVVVDWTNNQTVLTVDVDGAHATEKISQVKQISITTGNGADYIYIDPGIDIPASITTGSGNDTIRGGAGNNTITVGNGNDMIYGRGGEDVITAGQGNDTIRSGAGDNVIIVGDGNDSIVSGGGADKITAGSGNDTFLAGNSHDTITTGLGHDDMIGGLGNTYLYGKNTATAGTATSVSTTATNSGGSTPTNTNTNTNTNTGGSSTNSGTSGTGSTTKPVTTSSSGSSSSTGTTTTTTTSANTGGTGSKSTSKFSAPVAVINTMAGPRVTGIVVNVDGLESKLGVGTCITSNYAWNFGDPGTADDQTTGYNSAHVYDSAGTYTISLTVTDSDGQTSTATQQVNIAASTRNAIYVNPSTGSDSNPGTINAPLKSLPAAFNKLTANTEILLAAGQTFNIGQSMHVNSSNVLIGRYGTGANPVISRSFGNGISCIASYSGANGLTIQDITFTSPYGSTNPGATKIGVSGIYLGGENGTVRDCTFESLDDAINENGNPVGVLIQNNTAPLSVGLRGYFVWGQGAQQLIIGNTVAGSTKEHNIRLVGLDEVTVEDNTLTNHDGKGCIEMHEGQDAWIQGNNVTGGDIRLGPLGLWGESASSSTDWCVIEDNQLTDTFIDCDAGTHDAMIANNVVDNTSGSAINLMGEDDQGRVSSNITIINNTASDSGTQGNFITVWGYATGIVMQNNLFIAPGLQVGMYGTSPVDIQGNNLGDFTSISGNVWPAVDTATNHASGGLNYVGSTSGGKYLSTAQWDQLPNVNGDVFETVGLNSSYQLKIGNDLVGASLEMAA